MDPSSSFNCVPITPRRVRKFGGMYLGLNPHGNATVFPTYNCSSENSTICICSNQSRTCVTTPSPLYISHWLHDLRDPFRLANGDAGNWDSNEFPNLGIQMFFVLRLMSGVDFKVGAIHSCKMNAVSWVSFNISQLAVYIWGTCLIFAQ